MPINALRSLRSVMVIDPPSLTRYCALSKDSNMVLLLRAHTHKGRVWMEKNKNEDAQGAGKMALITLAKNKAKTNDLTHSE
jgi:hypothetical protein